MLIACAPRAYRSWPSSLSLVPLLLIARGPSAYRSSGVIDNAKVQHWQRALAHYGSLWRIGLNFYEFSLFQVNIQLPAEKCCRLGRQFPATRTDAHSRQCRLLKSYPAGKGASRAVSPLSQFLLGNEFVLKHNFSLITFHFSLLSAPPVEHPLIPYPPPYIGGGGMYGGGMFTKEGAG